MCDSMNELRRKAEERGEARGEARGIQQGIQQGMQQGIMTERRSMVQSMLRKGKYALDEIAELTSVPLREVQAMAGRLSQ